MSQKATGESRAVTNLTSEFGELARRRFMISPQNPVELERYSAPQPDLVLVPASRRFSKRHPTPEEIFLIVEVSDSSLEYDRTEKPRAYALAGIREFWILNLEADVLEIYREPAADGYRERIEVAAGGSAFPLAFRDVVIELNQIIPPR